MASPNSERAALEKLEGLVDSLKARHEWSDEDVDAIKSVIKLYRSFMLLGWLGGLVRPIIIGVAAVIGAIIAIRSGLIDLLGGVPK